MNGVPPAKSGRGSFASGTSTPAEPSNWREHHAELAGLSHEVVSALQRHAEPAGLSPEVLGDSVSSWLIRTLINVIERY
jgi:hypothetical protein